MIEFAYNNRYHSITGMAPCNALYVRHCRTPVCWKEVDKRKLYKPASVKAAINNVKVIKEKFEGCSQKIKGLHL